MLNGVSSTAEEMSPKGTVDELQEWKDAIGANGGARRFAVQEEWKQAKSEGIALFVESGEVISYMTGPNVRTFVMSIWDVVLSLKILYSGDPLLSIADHLTEKVCETRPTELCGAGAIEVPVINGFPV